MENLTEGKIRVPKNSLHLKILFFCTFDTSGAASLDCLKSPKDGFGAGMADGLNRPSSAFFFSGISEN